MNKKEPKCKNCWDKGYASVLVVYHVAADFDFEGCDKTIEEKHYCKCAKGKRLLKLTKLLK